jgi:uncharacterized SAM-binding protein YcdF (DUF218 family)
MFFIFSKLLEFLLTPVFWFFAFLLFLFLSKNTKLKKRATIASIIFFYIFSNSFLTDELVRAWEYEDMSIQSIEEIYDVGIMLGGIGYYDSKNNFFNFHKSSDRLWHTLELYHQGKIKKILLTGGSGSVLHPNDKESIYLKEFLLNLDIPEEDIIVEDNSRNTHENAMFSKELLDKYYPNGKYLMITSAFHMRRSIGCFNKVNLPVDYFVTDRYSGPRKYEFHHLFLPNIDGLILWTLFIHEITGYVVYDIVGYL